jgi:hypothetical protein
MSASPIEVVGQWLQNLRYGQTPRRSTVSP